jgi:hypothetical protein
MCTCSSLARRLWTALTSETHLLQGSAEQPRRLSRRLRTPCFEAAARGRKHQHGKRQCGCSCRWPGVGASRRLTAASAARRPRWAGIAVPAPVAGGGCEHAVQAACKRIAVLRQTCRPAVGLETLLRGAAGALDMVADRLLPRLDAGAPPLWQPPLAKMLANLCLADAQVCTSRPATRSYDLQLYVHTCTWLTCTLICAQTLCRCIPLCRRLLCTVTASPFRTQPCRSRHCLQPPRRQ